jgi:hypothetical protein
MESFQTISNDLDADFELHTEDGEGRRSSSRKRDEVK